jgi:hypothetical protein
MAGWCPSVGGGKSAAGQIEAVAECLLDNLGRAVSYKRLVAVKTEERANPHPEGGRRDDHLSTSVVDGKLQARTSSWEDPKVSRDGDRLESALQRDCGSARARRPAAELLRGYIFGTTETTLQRLDALL